VKLGRNDPCHCGSGKKYKSCHLHAAEAHTNGSETHRNGSDAPAADVALNGGFAPAQAATERVGQEEIRRILVEDFGFTNLEAYGRWIRDVRPGLSLTPALVAKLSPDKIDCRAFWQVCDSLFGIDPVHNVMLAPEVGQLPYPIETREDANRMNLRLAKTFGITSFLEETAHRRLKVLEIGPGFGSLKNYVETATEHVYTAIDVCPRFAGVIEATAEGFASDAFVATGEGSFSYVVSTNVFQHLSARQRSRWYLDARRLLHPEGLFIFNVLVDTAKISARARDREGNAWCDHYGQFTEIPKLGPLHDELGGLFRILYVTQRYDGVMNFVCQKR
jgi:hypothetical protein